MGRCDQRRLQGRAAACRPIRGPSSAHGFCIWAASAPQAPQAAPNSPPQACRVFARGGRWPSGAPEHPRTGPAAHRPQADAMASHHDAAAMSEDKQAEELLSESGSEDSDAAEGSEEEVRASAGPGSAWLRAASPLGAIPCACGRPGAVCARHRPDAACARARPVPLPAGWLLDLLVLQPQGQRVLLRGAGCCAGSRAAGATAGAAWEERRCGLDPRFRPGSSSVCVPSAHTGQPALCCRRWPRTTSRTTST